MAKRKKSKKPATSEPSAEVRTPETSETTGDETEQPSSAPDAAPGKTTAASDVNVAETAADGDGPAAEVAEVESEAAEAGTAEEVASDDAVAARPETSEEVSEEMSQETSHDASRDGEDAWPATDESTQASIGEPADGSTNPDAEAYASTWAAETTAESNAEVTDGDANDGYPAFGDAPLGAEGENGEAPTAETLSETRLESIIESLLFASDKALSLSDLKRLLGERDGKKISAAIENLLEHRKGTGIEITTLSTGWHLRTSAENAAWVSKLLVGRPVRLSRAMLETLAIVAYRQPVTRPEVDDIRGVDCGAVLKTLLDRGLIRIIGKKEEVGRPMLYGTTPEFLRVFNLRDLSELPTLREFYDLSAEDQSKVEAEHGPAPQTPSATTAKPEVALTSVARGALAPEPEEDDPLLDELDEASQLAKKALGDLEPPKDEAGEAQPQDAQDTQDAKNEPRSPAAEQE